MLTFEGSPEQIRSSVKAEIPVEMLLYSKIEDCFGDLDDPESIRILQVSGARMLNSLDERLNQLKIAAGSRDHESIIFQTHQLKGSFRTLGGMFLGDLCEQLEHKSIEMSDETLDFLMALIIEKSTQFKIELKTLLEDFQSSV